MKVKELMELLKTCPPDEEIILVIDPAGNKHSPMGDLSRDIYRPTQTINETCDTCGKIWNEIRCHSPYSGKLVDYERNRIDGDIDVVTLWPVS